MNPARKSAFRFACARVAVLCAIGLLAACGKPEPAQTAAGAAQQAPSPCVLPHLAPNAEFNANDKQLFAAVASGDLRAAAQALEAGANINATGALKRTPLFAAAFCDRPAMVSLLLENGAKHDVADANDMLPLHAAVVVGGVETARVLLANGANVNGKDAAGRTALHLAAATDQMPMVELLLAAKANTALRDKLAMTAAALAADNGHSKTASAIKQWQEHHKAPPP